MQDNDFAMAGSTGNSLSSGSPPHSSANVAPPTTATPASGAAPTVMQGTSGGSGQGTGSNDGRDMFGKKKRGRPRKYDAEGNLVAPSRTTGPSGSGYSRKTGRGRLLGSGDLFMSTAGWDFTPHMIMVNAGEDVAGKIASFVQRGPRGMCVLSANGSVSNVAIHQPGLSGSVVRYEGLFEIVSLSGLFSATYSGSWSGMSSQLSVSLAASDGGLIGGGVAGSLIAASPIQVVVGSFMPNGFKIPKRKNHRDYAPASASPANPEGNEFPTSTQVDHPSSKHHERQRDCEERIC